MLILSGCGAVQMEIVGEVKSTYSLSKTPFTMELEFSGVLETSSPRTDKKGKYELAG